MTGARSRACAVRRDSSRSEWPSTYVGLFICEPLSWADARVGGQVVLELLHPKDQPQEANGSEDVSVLISDLTNRCDSWLFDLRRVK